MEDDKLSVSKTGSLRLNSNKPRLSDLDPSFVIGLCEVMAKGAEKYGEYNWAKGQEYRTPLDSMSRHLLYILNGEDVDKESGKLHLLHIAANCMILFNSMNKNDKDLDNRHKWGSNEQ